MTVGKVTQDGVNALQPKVKEGKDGKPEKFDNFLWDDRLPGFGVKATPTGAKIYVYQYRLGGRGHPTKRVKIGVAGGMKAAVARGIAEALYAKVRQGEDVAEGNRERKRVSVELAFDKYVEQVAKPKLKRDWSKSWQEALAALNRHAIPEWKSKPLPSITDSDVVRLLKKLEDRPAAKRFLFATLSYVFNKAIEDKDGLKVSPLVGIKAPALVKPRLRTLAEDELRWLFTALQDEPEPYRGLVEDLLFTAQRRTEVAGLPWSELNRQRKEWHLPAVRAKNECEHIIPLTDKMIARLDALAGGEKWPKLGLVRKSREGTVLSGWSKMKRRLDTTMKKAAKEAGDEFKEWRLHDLRRTVATNLQRLGVQHEVVEHLLNHKEKARTGISANYQTWAFMPEKRKALERWEAELERIIRGDDAKVIPLRRGEG